MRFTRYPGQELARPLSKATQPKTKGPTPAQRAEKISTNTAKTTKLMDDLKEKKVTRSGLLSDKKYQFQDTNPDSFTEGELLDIFERTPMESSGDTVIHDIWDFGKEAWTGSPWERIKPTDEAINQLGVQEIGDILKQDGFEDSQIQTILGANKDKWTPSSMEPTSLVSEEIAGASTPENLKELSELNKVINDNASEVVNESVEVTKTLDEHLKSFEKAPSLSPEYEDVEWIDSPGEGFGDLAGDVDSLDEYYELYGATGETTEVAEALDALSTTAETAETGRDALKIAEQADKVGVLQSLDNLNKTSKIGGSIGKTLELGGTASGITGQLGQVAGGVKAAGGVHKLGKKGERGQGIEDIIQGTIAMASPALIAAGPVGWAVLGISAMEDLFFEDAFDLDRIFS
tara:strand:- start:1063 stop:2274 length:1212 start_codon:yes stop_codon:yes gene_type:complete